MYTSSGLASDSAPAAQAAHSRARGDTVGVADTNDGEGKYDTDGEAVGDNEIAADGEKEGDGDIDVDAAGLSETAGDREEVKDTVSES
jgi:hypothetical protein